VKAGGNMWPSLFKVLGGSLLTFALVWALVLGWWQSNDHQPGKLEIGLYLAACPWHWSVAICFCVVSSII